MTRFSRTRAGEDEETPLLAAEVIDMDDYSWSDRGWRRQASKLWSDYTDSLEKPRYALLVKSITGLVILGLGDFFGQVVEYLRGANGSSSSFRVDWPRVARFGAFGLFGAPWSHYYFAALDAWLPPTPESTLR